MEHQRKYKVENIPGAIANQANDGEHAAEINSYGERTENTDDAIRDEQAFGSSLQRARTEKSGRKLCAEAHEAVCTHLNCPGQRVRVGHGKDADNWIEFAYVIIDDCRNERGLRQVVEKGESGTDRRKDERSQRRRSPF